MKFSKKNIIIVSHKKKIYIYIYIYNYRLPHVEVMLKCVDKCMILNDLLK